MSNNISVHSGNANSSSCITSNEQKGEIKNRTVFQNKAPVTSVKEKREGSKCLHDLQYTPTDRSVANKNVKTGNGEEIEVTNQTTTVDPKKTDVNETAKSIANTLASNLDAIADKFIGDEVVCETITSKFTSLIGQLKDALSKLTAEGYGKDETGVAKGLVTLNSLLERYDSTGLGGFNRGQIFFSENTVINEASKAVKDSKKATEALENGLKEFEKNAQFKALFEKEENKDINLKTTEGLQKLKKALGESNNEDLANLQNLVNKKLDADIEVTKINVSDLRNKILERLGQLENANLATDPKERMLNLIQQVGFSAWLINDIIPAFGKENNPLSGLLSSQSTLSKIKELNWKARNTPMFSEIKLAGDLWNNFKAKLTPEEQVTLQGFEGIKFGLRGRSNYGTKTEGTHTLKVPTKPLYNTKNEKPEDRYIEKENTALKTGFVPTPTARGDALPQGLIELLNKYKEKDNELINHLKEKKVIEERNGNLVSKPSFAKIIDEAGFPTYCSVSGTTGELVSTLVYMLNDTPAKEELNDTLDTLLKLAKGTAGFEKVTKKDFSKFFAPIATFMEVGHFHTTAEVLGGFYSVAVAKSGQDITAEDMKKGFANLLGILKEHPEAFLGAVEKK